MKEGPVSPFHVILLAIIFDPKERKILISKRGEQDENIKNLSWQFPEGRLRKGDDIDAILKTRIKEKTGLEIENLGAVFSKVFSEKGDLLAIYYLCETVGGKIKPANDFTELKWVKPKEIERHFTTSSNKA